MLRVRPQILLLALAAACAPAPHQPDAGWWRGNLHTHSLWSDGDDFPEMIAAWYRDHGYHFVVFTEHDRLQEGEMWVNVGLDDEGWPPRREDTRRSLPAYRERFGADWLVERRDANGHHVRLRAMSEYRDRFEEDGRFLLLMGEEITDREGAHVNALLPRQPILPLGGAGPAERTRNNLRAVAEQDDAGARVLGIINHPNYLWALTAEEIAAIPDARIFELFNGHTHVNNAGDAARAGTERMWDVILSLRHAAGGPPVFGVATDDAHHYHADSDTVARPGRGWVIVRAADLDPQQLLAALDNGDFYASTGVTLRDVRIDEHRIRIDIEPEPGADYRTLFIGTRRDAPLRGTPVVDAAGDTLRTSQHYDAAVGAVLAQVDGATAEYTFTGDERYVRAKVVTTRIDPATGRSAELAAWTQPVFR